MPRAQRQPPVVHAVAALCFFALAASAQPLSPDTVTNFAESQGSLTTLQTTTVVLADGLPRLTIWSTVNASCTSDSSGQVCTPPHWLVVNLKDVYEVDASGQAVLGREGAAMLDTTLGTQWAVSAPQLGMPAVAASSATFSLPLRSQLPSCAKAPGATSNTTSAGSSGGGGAAVNNNIVGPAAAPSTAVTAASVPAPAPPVPAASVPAPALSAGATPGAVEVEVLLFGGDTNYTTSPSQPAQELLAGNVMISVRVDAWPFCSPSNSLVLLFTTLAPTYDDPAANVTVEDGTQLQATLEQQQADLTGASDPNSVPVPDGVAPPPAASRRKLLKGGGGHSSGHSSSSHSSGGKSSGSKGGNFGGSSIPTYHPAATYQPSSTSYKPGSYSSSRKTSGGAGTTPAPSYRPYWPNGGNSRPRYSTPTGAIASLPFTNAQRPYLNNAFANGRPVYGFGRPPYRRYPSSFLFFPVAGFGLGHYGPAMNANHHAIVNNNTISNVTVATPQAEAGGVQPVLVTFPYFSGSATYDQVVAITESDLVVSDTIEAAIDDTMGYADVASAAAPLAPRGVALAVLAGAAALLLLF